MALFGPQGNSAAFYQDGRTSSWQAIGWISGLGLTCYEYAYGRGFPVGDESLEQIAAQAAQYNMPLSMEGLYFMNLADGLADGKTMKYFDEDLRVARDLGAARMAFHPGSLGDKSREEALAEAKQTLAALVKHKNECGLQNLILCPEIADELRDLGTVDDIIQLCSIDECVYPGMAFGHLQAITGGSLKSKEDYAKVLDQVKSGVGEEKYRRMHIEFAHVEYSDAGEREKLTFADKTWGPFFEPLAELIVERDLDPWCICTSKDTQVEDAVSMKKMYEAAKEEA